MINIKGNGALATMLKQEEKTAFLSRQSPRVQKWAAQYEQDKATAKAELAEIGKEVTNAEVKFASKAQRRVIMARPQAEPKSAVVRIKTKQARRIRENPEVDGMEIYRHRWNAIKRIMWERGDNTWIPAWYKFFGDFNTMRDDRAVARDISFMKCSVKGMGLRY